MVNMPHSAPIKIRQDGDSHWWVVVLDHVNYPHIGVKFTPDGTGGGWAECMDTYVPGGKMIRLYKKPWTMESK